MRGRRRRGRRGRRRSGGLLAWGSRGEKLEEQKEQRLSQEEEKYKKGPQGSVRIGYFVCLNALWWLCYVGRREGQSVTVEANQA